MRASYLYRKIVLSHPVERHSISHQSLRLRALGGWSPHLDDDADLSFINRVFLNVTKLLKLALFIEKFNSLSKKQWMNTLPYTNEIKEKERERERERILYRRNFASWQPVHDQRCFLLHVFWQTNALSGLPVSINELPMWEYCSGRWQRWF